MANRLLDRQVSLLQYLTSGAAIFGDESATPLDLALRGIDPKLLRLEARFSHEKRMEKIIAAFPRTFAIFGNASDGIVRTFAKACPPRDISRLANARQFHGFLFKQWQRIPAQPSYLPDVAACEFAIARARAHLEAEASLSGSDAPRRCIRRRPEVVLLRCHHDVRAIFGRGIGTVVPEKRDLALAVAIAPNSHQPDVLELAPAVYDLLGSLDRWTDPVEFGAIAELNDLIGDLAAHGLVEVGG